MPLFHKSKKTKAAPRQQSDQQQANDSDAAPSVSSPDQPGSSVFARFKDRLRLDKQPGSSEANHRPGFFTKASHFRIDRGTFVDIGGNMIINRCMQDHELLILDKLPHVKNAGHRSASHDACLTGTRREELQRIEDWEGDVKNKRVYWLNGKAGIGKSTIAKTFAERTSERERLGASFFCSRDFDNRRDINLIFPTLAYHLACQYPKFKTALIQILSSTPDAGHETLAMQLETLLVRPLQSTEISTTIVIDALDECKDKQPVSAILWLLGRHIDTLPRVKFFITGRPEISIRAGFRFLKPHTNVFVLHEVDPASVNLDIELYVRTRLLEIAAQRSDCNLNVKWPTEEEISAVVTKCSGIFIVARIIIESTKSPHHTPQESLKMIISRPNSTVNEGKSGVDAMYDQIFLQSFDSEDVKMDPGPAFFDQLRLVVGSIALVFNPFSCADLATVLNITPESVRKSIRSLHSILIVPESDLELLRVCHKSFPDYLTDPSRCTDPRFHIDLSVYHSKLGMCCLALMNKELKKNICGLPRYAMNREVEDLGDRREKYVGSGLEYACKSWARHLCITSRDCDGVRDIMESLETVFKHNLLPWLEVLSIVADLGSAVYTLRDVKAWLAEVTVTDPELSAILTDGERFVLRFFDVIEASAPHIYDSALVWCPITSRVRNLYQDDIPKDVRLLNSVDNSWDACTRAIGTKEDAGSISYSHRDDLIGVCEDECVEIFEVSTGQRRALLTRNDSQPCSVGFSPDDTFIVTGCRSGIIDIWDVQTGSLVCALKGHTDHVKAVAFSPCGTIIASGSNDRTVRIWDVSSHRCQCVLKGHSSNVAYICWLGAGHTVVSGSYDGTVRVWDVVGKKCLKTLGGVESGVWSVACSADSAWIACGLKDGGVKIFDAKTYDVFQTIRANKSITSIRFSTRQQLMYMTNDSTFGIWDLTEKANVLLFKYDGSRKAMSSDGKSIASSNSKVIQLWQTDITIDREDHNKDYHGDSVTCVAFSGDGHLIASGSWDETAKVWDAATGLCLHTFHSHYHWVNTVTFSPDSRFCASASDDETLIGDVRTGTLISTLRTGSDVIRFSPDSSQLLSLNGNSLRLCEAKTGSLLAKVKVDRELDDDDDDDGDNDADDDYHDDDGHNDDDDGDDHNFNSNSHSNDNNHDDSDDDNDNNSNSNSKDYKDDGDDDDYEDGNDDIAFGVDGTSVILQSRHSVKRWRISPAPSSDHNLTTRINKNNPSSLPMVFVPMLDDQQHSTPPAIVPHQYRYEVKTGWVLDGQDRRVLWIPPNMKGRASDCCGKKIVVGSPTGKVILVDFSDHQAEHPV